MTMVTSPSSPRVILYYITLPLEAPRLTSKLNLAEYLKVIVEPVTVHNESINSTELLFLDEKVSTNGEWEMSRITIPPQHYDYRVCLLLNTNTSLSNTSLSSSCCMFTNLVHR